MNICRLGAWVCVVCVSVLVAACAAPRSPAVSDQIAPDAPTWPQAPAQARIRFVRSLSGPSDLGITKSIVERVIDALLGKGDERFVRPTGVAELSGTLYVADPGAQALWIIDSNSASYSKIDKIGDTSFLSPVAVAVRPDGAVFIADSLLNKVLLVDRRGKLIHEVKTEPLERPAALAFDSASERLYVADSARHQIAVYSEEGALLYTWGRAGTGDGEFNFPTYLALDRKGTILVTDALNFRIQAFDQQGHFLWKFGQHGDGSGTLAAPKGLAADTSGHIYLVDALFDNVQIFDRDGTYLLAFGEQGSQRGQFWLPSGLFINAQDRIFIADSYNRRVQVFIGVSIANGEQQK